MMFVSVSSDYWPLPDGNYPAVSDWVCTSAHLGQVSRGNRLMLGRARFRPRPAPKYLIFARGAARPGRAKA